LDQLPAGFPLYPRVFVFYPSILQFYPQLHFFYHSNPVSVPNPFFKNQIPFSITPFLEVSGLPARFRPLPANYKSTAKIRYLSPHIHKPPRLPPICNSKSQSADWLRYPICFPATLTRPTRPNLCLNIIMTLPCVTSQTQPHCERLGRHTYKLPRGRLQPNCPPRVDSWAVLSTGGA
jgi:hypothetical protein